jgi:hypothetical protein
MRSPGQSMLQGEVTREAQAGDPGADDPVHAFDDADPGRRLGREDGAAARGLALVP